MGPNKENFCVNDIYVIEIQLVQQILLDNHCYLKISNKKV